MDKNDATSNPKIRKSLWFIFCLFLFLFFLATYKVLNPKELETVIEKPWKISKKTTNRKNKQKKRTRRNRQKHLKKN